MNPNDPDVIDLSKAIVHRESGGNPNAVGDAGTSHGIAQWQPETWKGEAKDVLGDENAPMSEQNQKAVLQVTVAKWKSEGLNPAQIAAKWNSGSPDGWENKIGTATINGQKIPYNVPQYVKDVTDQYQTFKQQRGGSNLIQGQNQQPAPQQDSLIQPQNNSDQLDQQIQQLTQKGKAQGSGNSFTQDLSSGNFGGAAVDAVKGVGNFLFPSVADAGNLLKGTNTKTPLQLAGDLGSSALGAATLIPGVGEIAAPLKGALMAGKVGEAGLEGANIASKVAPTIASQIGKNAALGGAYGVTGALGSGETDPTKIAEGGAIGAGTGGVVGAAGGLLSKAADVLPQRLVQGAIKNANPDVAKYALTKSMGSPAKMLQESDVSLKSIGEQLGTALKHEHISDVTVPSDQIIPKIQAAFPDAELTPQELQSEINKLAPLKKRLTTKLFSGEGLTIDELHSLNSEVGRHTFKTVFDDPAVKAGKDIGNAFYQASKSIITDAAPDTAPLFEQYSREKALNTALYKATQRGNKAQAITLPDLVAMVSGLTALGPLGGAGAFIGERAMRSPTVNLKAAGLLNKAAGQGINRLTAPATIGATGLLNQAVRSMQGGR